MISDPGQHGVVGDKAIFRQLFALESTEHLQRFRKCLDRITDLNFALRLLRLPWRKPSRAAAPQVQLQPCRQ